MRTLTTGAALIALAAPGAGPAWADDIARAQLRPFTVTVRAFDPARGVGSGHDYVLPVDSPDAEHAAAATMADAVSFTKKIDGGRALPVAFTCVKVEPR